MLPNLKLFLIFLRLGLTSFGGPVAHLSYFREEFVMRRRWFSDEEYADKVALCQLIPGPASSQVGLLIGYSRSGYLGAFLAWLGFTLPSAVALAYLGLAMADPESLIPNVLLTLLKAIALAVILQAVIGMTQNFCKTALHWGLMLGCALILSLVTSPWATPLVILAAGAITLLSSEANEGSEVSTKVRLSLPAEAIVWLVVFASGLVLLPMITAGAGLLAELANGLFRAGALVFGGGHVVLPLLAETTVQSGLISSETFISGYGAAQAVPGPLFTFAAFLGGAISADFNGALVATLAIFTPAVAILFGVLPIWEQLKRLPAVRLAIGGANAAVVGVLLAALVALSWQTLNSPLTALFAAVAFLLIEYAKVPAWVLVALATAGSYLNQLV
ncbi:MAG: chromate efflux transporter [Oceanospirillaceae bacterium]|nr:chromate efflux transporter [Oceanospirillaceae bacterium]